FFAAIGGALTPKRKEYLDLSSSAGLDSLFSLAAQRRQSMLVAPRIASTFWEHVAELLAAPLNILVVIASVIYSFARRARVRPGLIVSVTIMAAGFLVLRAGLFAVFEANAAINSHRYMSLLSPLLPVLLALVTTLTLTGLRTLWLRCQAQQQDSAAARAEAKPRRGD
nr:hypothetical protein [Gemmatimonadota bacterium]